MGKDIRWKAAPENHDFPAAQDLLSLLLPDDVAARVVAELQVAAPLIRKAKDLLRASGLPVLGEDNEHVAKDLRKIDHGEEMSPVLLLRGDVRIGRPLVVADGYHRICAIHHLDEDAEVHCRIADLE